MTLEPDTGPHPEKSVQDFRLSMVGLVTKTIDLWVKKLLKYAALFLVPAVLVILIDLAALYVLLGPEAVSGLAGISSDPIGGIIDLLLPTGGVLLPLAVSIGLGFVGLIVYSVAGGAAIKFTLDGYGGSQPGDVRSSFSFAFSRLAVLVGVQLLASLIRMTVALPALIGLSWFALNVDPENPYSIDMNMLLLVFAVLMLSLPLIIYVSVRLTPVLAVPIAEEHGIIESLKRGWALTHASFWHIFGAQILLGIIVAIIDLVVSFIGIPLGYAGEWIAIPVLAVLGVIIVSPMNYVFLAVLIKDLQPRGETQKQEYW